MAHHFIENSYVFHIFARRADENSIRRLKARITSVNFQPFVKPTLNAMKKVATTWINIFFPYSFFNLGDVTEKTQLWEIPPSGLPSEPDAWQWSVHWTIPYPPVVITHWEKRESIRGKEEGWTGKLCQEEEKPGCKSGRAGGKMGTGECNGTRRSERHGHRRRVGVGTHTSHLAQTGIRVGKCKLLPH